MPGILIDKPGQWKGCLEIIYLLKFNSRPNILTSSLNKYFNGSTNFNFILFGRPPTLWWDLIFDVWLPVTDLLSIKSGYRVPWAKNFTFFIFFAYFSKSLINKFPIIFLFFYGSVTFFNLLINNCSAFT